MEDAQVLKAVDRERDVEAYVRSRIEAMDGLLYKLASPGQDGAPDRIAIMPDGRLIFVELKTERGTLTEAQKYQCRKLVNRNQQVCVVFGMPGARELLKDLRDKTTVSWRTYRGKGGAGE